MDAWLKFAFVFTLVCALSLVLVPAPPRDTIERTPEGWLLIITDRQSFVHRFCGSDNPTIIGCARWVREAPDPDCIMMVLKGGDPSDPSFTEQDLIDHEKRHCREGHWHDGKK